MFSLRVILEIVWRGDFSFERWENSEGKKEGGIEVEGFEPGDFKEGRRFLI